MPVELQGEERLMLKPLFEKYPYLHGSAAAAVEGGMGRVYVDNPGNPQAALAMIDFCLFAGRPDAPGVPALFGLLRPDQHVLLPTSAWEQTFRTNFPGRYRTYTREAFQAGSFDRERLRGFVNSIPAGAELRRVRLEDIPQFTADLDPALVYNFTSHEDFIARGVGFGIRYNGLFVSGASSAAIGGGKLEVEIQTHRSYFRQGWATAAAAALVLYCLDNGLEPCWDAANPPSAGLAKKLAFISTGPYTAYHLTG